MFLRCIRGVLNFPCSWFCFGGSDRVDVARLLADIAQEQRWNVPDWAGHAGGDSRFDPADLRCD
jgi:hypothetical protein